MLKLNLKSEPEWIDLPRGVRLNVLPYSTLVALAARDDVRMRQAAKSGVSHVELSFVSGVAVARAAIIAWEGVGDANGDPVDANPDTIAQLMNAPDMYDAFFLTYLVPALVLDDEKNGSAPSQNGTTAAARTTAYRAPRSAKAAKKLPTRR